jgi:hypothetical protein
VKLTRRRHTRARQGPTKWSRMAKHAYRRPEPAGRGPTKGSWITSVVRR